MDKIAFNEKFEELLKNATAKTRIKAESLFYCGGIDTKTPPNQSYELPRVILTVALLHAMDEFYPRDPQQLADVENLKHF